MAPPYTVLQLFASRTHDGLLLKVPSLEKDEDYAYDAASQLSFLVGGGKTLKASVIMTEKAGWGGNKHPKAHHPKKFVVLSEAGAEKDINAQMLESKRSNNPPLSFLLAAALCYFSKGFLDLCAQKFCASAGFARLPPLETIRNPHLKAAAQKYAEYEAVARKQHRGIFIYGDPGSSHLKWWTGCTPIAHVENTEPSVIASR